VPLGRAVLIFNFRQRVRKRQPQGAFHSSDHIGEKSVAGWVRYPQGFAYCTSLPAIHQRPRGRPDEWLPSISWVTRNDVDPRRLAGCGRRSSCARVADDRVKRAERFDPSGFSGIAGAEAQRACDAKRRLLLPADRARWITALRKSCGAMEKRSSSYHAGVDLVAGPGPSSCRHCADVGGETCDAEQPRGPDGIADAAAAVICV